MTRRFTESDKWSDPWFRGLKPEFKLSWLYLLDSCDIAGFIDLDEKLASFQIGFDVDWQRFMQAAGNRVDKLSNGKLWIVRFVEFQQGSKSLNQSNNCHRGILKRFVAHGVNPIDFGYLVAEKSSPSLAPSEPLARGIGKGKGKSKGKSSGKVDYSPEYLRWYDAYPRHEGKADGQKTFRKAIKAVSRSQGIEAPKAVEFLVSKAAMFAKSKVGTDKQYLPLPATWLNGERWDDDLTSVVEFAESYQPRARRESV